MREALALAKRAAEAGERYREVLAELEFEDAWRDEWPARLVARRDSQDPEQCLVEVTVQPPGREWPGLALR